MKEDRGNGMKDYGDIAARLFCEGYNCAQSVLLAFEDMTGLERDTALRLSSSFGGGLGRMREVCGAVSGAAMVLGLVRGYSDPENHRAKREHYALVQEFAKRFKEKNGSIICRELLKGSNVKGGNEPEMRTAEYYRNRPCAKLCGQAAEIVGEMLASDKV